MSQVYSKDNPDRCRMCSIQPVIQSVSSFPFQFVSPVAESVYRDFSSAKLFAEAGVQLRRFDPTKQRLSTPPPSKEDPENYSTSTIDMNGSDEDSPILG